MPKDFKKEQKAAAIEKGCGFCKSKTEPMWKEIENLKPYLTVRGRIMPRALSGVCSTHQKALAKAVKQARHLALLPFVTQE